MKLSKLGAVLIFSLIGFIGGGIAAKPIAAQVVPGYWLKGAPEEDQAKAMAIVYAFAAIGAATGGSIAALANRRRVPL